MQRKATNQDLRKFGLIVGSLFGLLGVWPALVHGRALRTWAVTLAGVLAVSALVFPRSLAHIHQGWMKVGHVLGWINTRIIMGVIFFVLFTPLGLVMDLMGKDPMLRRFEPNLDSYRVKKGTRPTSHMNLQF